MLFFLGISWVISKEIPSFRISHGLGDNLVITQRDIGVLRTDVQWYAEAGLVSILSHWFYGGAYSLWFLEH